MYPSTCGLIVAECRDFSSARYSVVSAIGFDSTNCTWTGIAASAPPSPLALTDADFAPHPATAIPARHTKARQSTDTPYLACFLIPRVICSLLRGLRSYSSYVKEAGIETPNRISIGRVESSFV